MTQDEQIVLRVLALFLLAQFWLVYCDGSLLLALSEPAAAKSGVKSPDKSTAVKEQASTPSLLPQVHYGTDGLPPPVEEMREVILSAVRSGRIEDLRHAWDLNELKPDLGVAATDPITHWKQISGDGEGREILAALAQILDAGYVVLPLGADIENPRLYVWPYFAEVPLDRLTPAQEVELLRLVTPTALKQMRLAGAYTHWRIVIGADGTWHAFRRAP
ncbi:MAG: hypothetical protein J2P51_08295 [Hyphomicrobiaceae bacterium]|nr:hypothetical protein [Hyphomicrobiaceae bacterium]